MGWVVNATPRPLYLRERFGTHCIGGCMGITAGLDRCGKPRCHRDSIAGRPARSESLHRLRHPGSYRRLGGQYIRSGPFGQQQKKSLALSVTEPRFLGRQTPSLSPHIICSVNSTHFKYSHYLTIVSTCFFMYNNCLKFYFDK